MISNIKRIVFLRLVLLLLLVFNQKTTLQSQNFSGGFNFNMPPFDSTSQVFLPLFPRKTIGEADRVTVVDDKFMAKGQPIRFWGVNIVGGACFPKKEDAPQIAGRMRKMGINIVRFHDLENGYSEPDGSIFDWDVSTRHLRPTTLDRMEYFIAELKKNNIYVNMNLNVARRYLEADGVAGADTLFRFGDRGKGVALFEPYLQFLQREYAEQLLTHVNPYTNLPLANDPVLALVELNNENTIYGEWKSNGLLQKNGPFGELTYQHNRVLDNLFQTFLTQKYTTNVALTTAWQPEVIDPREIIQNGGFETGTLANSWVFEVDTSAAANIAVDNANRNTGSFSARINATKVTNFDNHIQLRQTGFPVADGKSYEISFWAKSDVADGDFRVQMIKNEGNFDWLTNADLKSKTTWTRYTIPFTANLTTANARLNIMPRSVAMLWLDDISVRQTSKIGLRSSENLTNKNVERLPWWERRSYTVKRVSDIAEFYIGLQKKHFEDMRQYLRTTLNVKAAITGTNGFTNHADVLSQTAMDYLDDHKYWDLGAFKDGIWNTTDWFIQNKSMFKATDLPLPAISNGLLGMSMSNKPYTISEYNYSAPNQFRSEMPALLLPYAALHGVDGIMFFDYNAYDRGLDWQSDFNNNYLGLHRDHSVMSQFPTLALAFRNGYIKEDVNPIKLNFTPQKIYESPFKDDYGRWEQYVPHDKRWGLIRSIKTDGFATNTDAPVFQEPTNNIYVTATNETRFDRAKNTVAVATPKFVSISGYLNDVPNTIVGDMQLMQASQFGCLNWISLDNNALKTATKSLITLATRQTNTNMVWGIYENDPTKITVRDQWGTTPTLQQPATVRLKLMINAKSINVYPLSSTGNFSNFKTYFPTSNTFDITLDQNSDKTLVWYRSYPNSRS